MLTVNANTNELVIDRGDDQTLRVTIKDSTGAALNVTGGTFKFTVKDSRDDAIGSAIFQLTNPTANGIDVTAASTGIIDVIFPDTNLQGMAGYYFYDLEMTLSGNVRTLIPASVFRVRKDISTPGVAGSAAIVVTPFPGAISLDGYLYMKDATTGLYSALRINNGLLETSDDQSATLPFTPTWS